MRLLLDQNLSVRIVDHLAQDPIHAVHVRDVGHRDATDTEILEYARHEGFVIVSQDTDFSHLIAHQRANSPSVLLLRGLNEVTAKEIAQLIADNLTSIAEVLSEGAIASMLPDRIRVRSLPIL